ncbi:AAA family ATPase [Paraburkholderia sp. SIMBA_054]|uniref:trifunctional serine/threonine-protein kinase/ATP-binding protein/sensor histidine kinase n=1 Tax=Paraburkholderia sp. SIMBA_054 TaxID=3085795 RepID=UPI0039784B5B
MTNRLLRHSVLLRDGAIELLRSWDSDGASCLLATTSADRALGALRVIQREYALRSRLNSGWAALPLHLTHKAAQIQMRLQDPGGIALRDLCRQHLPFGQILALSLSVASATSAMHAAGLLHRDISPDNILFDLEHERATLTGFGNAIDSANHTGRPIDRDFWITSYAYLAPELSGQINRSIDARSDIYSIGCVLYELVTGTPPFAEGDLLGAVHSHLAAVAPPIRRIRPDLPAVYSDIVAKLIAKDANDRYLSADGLVCDLDRCLREFRKTGTIESFPLDHIGAARRLISSGRLCGRDEEVHSLASAFDRTVERGCMETVLLSGPSGSGKSALAWHLHMSRIDHAHVFATGKCGEVEAAVPYGCIFSAMSGLLRNALRQSESDFNDTRQRLRDSLKNGAEVFASLLPELRFFIDEVNQITLQPAQLEKERFFEMVRRFLTCFATERAPLVLFIDDLQWADSGTSAVIEFLCCNAQIDHLLLICATRSTDHLNTAERAVDTGSQIARGVFGDQIELCPLSVDAVTTLIVAAFGCKPDYGHVLARLVHAKTGGSPFFVIQFLGVLLGENLISFDGEHFTWHWDIDGIREKGYTSNVADLLLARIQSLHDECLLAMQSLACLGDRSSLSILSAASGREESALRAALEIAEEAQLVISDDVGYAFVHDRIRDAVYGALKKRDAHKIAHAQIGRRLAVHFTREPSRALLFLTAHQINLGECLPVHRERAQFAAINLEAGIEAKRSADYLSALDYLKSASNFASGTHDCIAQTLIEFHTAECEFMTGRLESAEERLRVLCVPLENVVLRAEVARLKCALHTTTGQVSRAIEVGSNFLNQCGIHFPSNPSEDDVDKIKYRLIRLIDAHQTSGIKIGDKLADAKWSGVTDVLSDLIPPALFSNNATLGDFIKFTSALVTLEHGCCGSSGYGLVCAASSLIDRFHDTTRGLMVGEWALELSRREGLDRLAARVSMVFGVCVLPWVRAVRSCQSFIRDATARAYEDCDLTFSVYCRRNMVSNMLFAGTPLTETACLIEEAWVFAKTAGFRMVSDTVLAQLMLTSTLRGCYEQTFSSKGLDASWPDNLIRGTAKTSTGAYAYWAHKLQVAVLFRHWQDALQFEWHAASLISASAAHLEAADLPLYGAFVRAAAYIAEPNPEQREIHLSALRKHCATLMRYAESCPENFTDRAALACAELARVEGRTIEAQVLYERAIDHACQQGFVHIEALAYEAAAQFYASIRLPTVSEALLRNARYAYQTFCAEAKVRDIEARMSRRIDSHAGPTVQGGVRSYIDTEAVIVASHALSSEMVLPHLLEVLLKNVIEHAGAVRCVVALQVRGNIRIEAEAHTTSTGVVVTLGSRELEMADIPAGILLAVNRTHQTILSDDATASAEYRDDPVVFRRRIRSVLCLPLLKQASLIGVLYAENAEIAGAFTAEKASLLEVLASQAAISLENARLYAEAIESNNRRETAEAALRDSREELARASRLSTMGQLVASIVHEVSQPLVSIATYSGAALRWMNREQPNLAEISDALERIQGDSTRAGEIVRGLRALAKRSPLNFNNFDLNKAVREVLQLARGQIEKYEITLHTDGLDEPCRTWGDRVQIQQVVLNLVVNATEAMETITDRERNLTLATRRSDGEVILVVEDTGTGIATNVLHSVFSPFVTTKQDGMGMGLSICASIIEMHKGRLTANNRIPFGTRFEAIFPDPHAIHNGPQL